MPSLVEALESPDYVAVERPDGSISAIPSASAQDASSKGYKPADPAKVRKIVVEGKYGDDDFLAGAAGAARGLSFGLSDLALTETGLVEAETLRGLKEANPISSGVGEYGAIAAATLLSGGAAGVAQAGARGGLVGLTGALGQTVSRGAAKVLGKSVAGKLGAAATAAAAEGALFGAGQEISEASLEERELTAEALLQKAGMGAALSGVFAGGLWGAPKMLGAAGRKISSKFTKEITEESIGGLAKSVSGDDLPPGVIKKLTQKIKKEFIEAAETTTGTSKADIERVLNNREVATSNINEIQDSVSRRMANVLNKRKEAGEVLKQASLGKMKLERVKELVPKGNEVRVSESAFKVLDDVDGILAGIEAEPGIYGFLGHVKKFRKDVSSVRSRINGFAEKNDPNFSAHAFDELNSFKQRLGKFAFKRRGQSTVSNENDTVSLLKESYKNIVRPQLEDTALYGKAGELQSSINGKYVNHLKDIRIFEQKFFTRGDELDGIVSKVADPEKIRSFLPSLGTAKADLPYKAFKNQMTSEVGLADDIGKYFELDELGKSALGGMRSNSDEAAFLMADIEDKVITQNIFQNLSAASKDTGGLIGSLVNNLTTVGGAAGFALGGVPGAVAGAATGGAIKQFANAAFRPSEAIKTLSLVDGIRRRSKMDIGSSIESFLGKASGLGAKVGSKAPPLAAKSLLDSGFSLKEGPREKNKREAYKARKKQISDLASNPVQLMEKMAQSMHGLEGAAPGMSSQVMVTASKAVQFLQGKIPRAPGDPGIPGLTGSEWEPTDREIDKFEKYFVAIEDPMSVLGDLNSGAVSRESMEAIQFVYPETHSAIVNEAVRQLSERKEPISYYARLALSNLLGSAMDQSMHPGALSIRQEFHGRGKQQDPQQGARPRKMKSSAIGKMSLDETLKTRTSALTGS